MSLAETVRVAVDCIAYIRNFFDELEFEKAEVDGVVCQRVIRARDTADYVDCVESVMAAISKGIVTAVQVLILWERCGGRDGGRAGARDGARDGGRGGSGGRSDDIEETSETYEFRWELLSKRLQSVELGVFLKRLIMYVQPLSPLPVTKCLGIRVECSDGCPMDYDMEMFVEEHKATEFGPLEGNRDTTKVNIGERGHGLDLEMDLDQTRKSTHLGVLFVDSCYVHLNVLEGPNKPFFEPQDDFSTELVLVSQASCECGRKELLPTLRCSKCNKLIHEACYITMSSKVCVTCSGDSNGLNRILLRSIINALKVANPNINQLFDLTNSTVVSILKLMFKRKALILIPDKICNNKGDLMKRVGTYTAGDHFLFKNLVHGKVYYLLFNQNVSSLKLPKPMIEPYLNGKSSDLLYQEILYLKKKQLKVKSNLAGYTLNPTGNTAVELESQPVNLNQVDFFQDLTSVELDEIQSILDQNTQSGMNPISESIPAGVHCHRVQTPFETTATTTSTFDSFLPSIFSQPLPSNNQNDDFIVPNFNFLSQISNSNSNSIADQSFEESLTNIKKSQLPMKKKIVFETV